MIAAQANESFAAAAVAMFTLGSVVIGAQLMLYSLAPRHYPARIRATGVGAAVSAGRLGAIAGPLLAGWLFVVGSGPQATLFTIVPLVPITGGLALWVVLSRRPR